MERTERIDRGMERTDGASVEQQQQAWGKLVRVGPSTESVLTLLLVNRECTVGRRKGCDLSFPANKLVSSDHCKLTQDQESGQVWLEDTSTNGTVINMSKLLKKQRHLLQNGDVIYFVYRKSEPEQNIAYVYHSITAMHSDSQDTEELSCPELMERIDPDVDPDPVEPVTLPFVPQEVKVRPGFQESQPSTSYNIAKPTTHTHTHTLAGTGFSEVRSAQSSVKRTDGERETDKCAQPDRKRQKTDDPYRGYAVGESGAPAAPPKSGKDGGEECKTDKMEESLTCIICQDLLYDCVSLQPCMHTFCAACYSGWMERSSLCPTCRCPVERIRKNHILNNLVEAYLLQHPEKCRSEEDMRSMDARNKITQDMLQPKVERYFSDEEGSSDYLFELSDNDSDTSDLSQPYMTCRQCPGYKKDFSPAPWICGSAGETGPTPGDGPSTSSDTCAETQEFTCPPHGSHLICTCCLQPMPDRRAEHVGTNPSPQHCLVCQRPFCHLYWGCQRIGCQGCLARFSDLNLTEKCLDGVLNNNHYESEILQNYLSSRGKTWKEMLQETLQSTQQGLCHLSDYRINGNSFLCYCCGLRFFKELAYVYRANIPAAELPAAVTVRPDCYWGRNCRTQIKAHHAMKFNHICEQTRFKN
ncbi:E3 ubiquitin-protein ligase CHFR [Ictalurus punctatus]|uniref:E3 ubiquitin-protein ligase CHFR n=1 Tax=Ictalurus punctatus TaxID=7998 RepID=A0A2D0PLJ8_ICTPU|nr:E3 ubiquitin-protein ligase CHFR [Ictalurus punctatus]XP_017306907.1 E3 ubiquitin-protein ligase CHFR [Ictalurus punctatus]